MDRQICYTGAIPQNTDVLSTNKNTLYAVGYLAQAALGTGTCVIGLAGAQTTIPSLQITIGAGAIFSSQPVDATAYGDLGTDANTVVKQGILKAAQTLTLTAPTTSGYSQVYLVEAAYQDIDGGSMVVPYYDASNPANPYAGPGNAGTSNYTVRQGACVITLKAGTAAPTGSQTTPSTDAGYVPLYTVTLANGQTGITTAQIITAVGAPFVPYNLNTIPNLTANTSLAGQALNISASRASTTTATWTADEIVAKTALGGLPRVLSPYNQTFNGATTGAGGMDTGSLPTSTWLYIYAIYNPTTATTSILGTVAGSGASVYSGANMPSGYTYSALIGTFKTNASSQIPIFIQRQNIIAQPQAAVVTGGVASTLTSVNISSGVPPNAKTVDLAVVNTSGSSGLIFFAYEATGTILGSSSLSTGGWSIHLWSVMMMTPQTIYYYQTGGLSLNINIGQYTI